MRCSTNSTYIGADALVDSAALARLVVWSLSTVVRDLWRLSNLLLYYTVKVFSVLWILEKDFSTEEILDSMFGGSTNTSVLLARSERAD